MAIFGRRHSGAKSVLDETARNPLWRPENMDRPCIHVVIVNWNSGAQLKECLASFAAVASDEVAVRVTVVDNASSDGSADGLEGVTSVPLAIVRNADNRGFGAACNQGAAGSNADYLLFLNPDTRLMPGSLERPARH